MADEKIVKAKDEAYEKSDMMRHYDEVKKQYNDCIVFYRLGDFYEMFNDDAKVVSEVLGLTLTSRASGSGNRAPMCGVPFHSADSYIAELVNKGFKVAICEQLTEPTKGKKLVERDVIKVVTAGTLTETELIDEKTNNFICSLYISGETAGVSWADITTGEFKCRKTLSADELFDLLVRISPSEIICNPNALSGLKSAPLFDRAVLRMPAAYKESAYSYGSARINLLEQFKVKNLLAFSIDDEKEIICSAGALLEYLKETQKRSLENVADIALERKEDAMLLDSTCLRNLEITRSMRDGKVYGSLLWVMDQTKTGMGARALRSALCSPLQSPEKINYRLDGVEEFYKNYVVLTAVRDALSEVKDVERITGNVSNGVVTPRDMVTLWKSLAVIPSIKFNVSGFSSQAIKDINNALTDQTELVDVLRRALKDPAPNQYKEGGFIAEGFDETFDNLCKMRSSGKEYLDRLEESEREKTGIKNLKIGYNKIFGYYIEVTNSFKDKVPYGYVRKQTLVGAERYITEELKKFEEDILSSSERALRLEIEIFYKLRSLLESKIGQLKAIAKAFAALDVICSLAYVAKKNDYVRPEIAASDETMDITGGRHPVVEAVSREKFIANDCYLGGDDSMMIITGPNMAGKSTYMRQVALIAIMAHVGSFVPAKYARIPIIDRVFTRVGASDNLIFDQSTFMVEMSEVAMILRFATKNSLLVLDEIGRGTSTYDGLSIAWAVVEYACKKIKAKTLFATHYHELSELEGVLEGVKNYKITVKESDGEIMFLRKIVRGSANRSFGIEVAALAGVPAQVTARAKTILTQLEKKDLTKAGGAETISEAPEVSSQAIEIEKELEKIDADDLTPREAFDIICRFKEMLVKKD